MNFLIIAAGLNILAVPPANWGDDDWSRFANAIRKVETGGKSNSGLGCVGDGGEALGPFQIHECAFKDAQEYSEELRKYRYDKCLDDYELSKKVLIAYVSQYNPKGNDDAGIMARIWNGGPKGYKKSSTFGYLGRFLRYFRK